MLRLPSLIVVHEKVFQSIALTEGVVSVILTNSFTIVEVSCSEGRDMTQPHFWRKYILFIFTLNLEIRAKSELRM